MEKIVKIDGQELKLAVNGGTPRIYRSLFRKDLFQGMNNAMDENGDIKDSEVFENLAFVMAIQGGSLPMAAKIDDWLNAMTNPMAIMEAAPDILDLWLATKEETSTAKKE